MTGAAPGLLTDLDPAAVAQILDGATLRDYAPGEPLCEQGQVASTVLVLRRGAADVLVGGEHRVRRLRRGDVVGEVSLLTGEPRSATVRATAPTQALELGRDGLLAALAEHPQLLVNLSRILSRRLARAHVEQVPSGRGEAVGVVLAASARPVLQRLLTASAAATPRSVTSLGVAPVAGTAATVATGEDATLRLDDLLVGHGVVLVVAGDDTPELSGLVAQLDRTVVVGTPAETDAVLERLGSGAGAEAVDLSRGTDWLARLLTRTRLGLALGAGGAKGYAHVGALTVLEEAGYTVDAVSGTSIGAVVGACIAMGQDSAEIETTLRKRFSPEVVKAVFTLSFTGASSGPGTMEELTRELAGDLDTGRLPLPFVAVAADLETRLPVELDTGPLADALLASTALAGLFPPFVRGGQRLVDGLALVPVPVEAVARAGADVTVSVNLMSRDTLPAWPGEEPPPPPGGRQRMLETLLEVMDLTQLDASVRHAGLADVVITPRFGPCTWRDFHLADRFQAAGREAATASLDRLRTLASPMQTGERHG